MLRSDADDFGLPASTVALQEFIESVMRNVTAAEIDDERVPPYVFQSGGLANALAEDLPEVPDFLQAPGGFICRQNTNRQWYLGGAGSGAPYHYHKDAWNVAVFGRKRWFLTPPLRSFYSSQPVADWLRADGERRDRPLECVQEPGDILYVPHMWGHATLNLADCVGMATEFEFCPWYALRRV